MAEVVPDLRVASVRLQYCDITKVKGSVLGRLETWLERRCGYCWSGFFAFYGSFAKFKMFAITTIHRHCLTLEMQ